VAGAALKSHLAQRPAFAFEKNMWKIKLWKNRSTWHWFTENPQGGGFGSNLCGPQKHALTAAMRNIPSGADYQLFINDKLIGSFTRP
jgi:hypothetical protein